MPWWGMLLILAVSVGIAYGIFCYLKRKGDGSVRHTGNMTLSAWLLLIGLSFGILYVITMRIMAAIG